MQCSIPYQKAHKLNTRKSSQYLLNKQNNIKFLKMTIMSKFLKMTIMSQAEQSVSISHISKCCWEHLRISTPAIFKKEEYIVLSIGLGTKTFRAIIRNQFRLEVDH